eukprot:CAMPEP_0113878102 /NCGR_PEP_ID=MMETSP0780_2-20120614/6478_1 /TAXON_ID=652834 /ORGANISM="Palpitomonas bilix" /LENGTH=43 /DNA_ID=CAMNT_0000864499 /DNA_START=42 /DNA_END=173 /DNA_ORIENTATION=+ /assembly_acc=CAM_ASM_000599
MTFVDDVLYPSIGLLVLIHVIAVVYLCQVGRSESKKLQDMKNK